MTDCANAKTNRIFRVVSVVIVPQALVATRGPGDLSTGGHGTR